MSLGSFSENCRELGVFGGTRYASNPSFMGLYLASVQRRIRKPGGRQHEIEADGRYPSATDDFPSIAVIGASTKAAYDAFLKIRCRRQILRAETQFPCFNAPGVRLKFVVESLSCLNLLRACWHAPPRYRGCHRCPDSFRCPSGYRCLLMQRWVACRWS